MARKKSPTQIMLDDELYMKLYNISFAQKKLKGNKQASMSSIIDKAIREYFANHKEELNALFDEYREKGVNIEI